MDSHEQRAGDPVIEHSRQRCLGEEGDARLNVGFCEQPDCTSIKNNATAKREDHKLDENEASDLKNLTIR